jgi:hypothetical protein
MLPVGSLMTVPVVAEMRCHAYWSSGSTLERTTKPSSLCPVTSGSIWKCALSSPLQCALSAARASAQVAASKMETCGLTNAMEVLLAGYSSAQGAALTGISGAAGSLATKPGMGVTSWLHIVAVGICGAGAET